jgi:hypothetical protein
MHHLKLKNGPPLFFYLTQRPSGEVDAVISNIPEVELKAEKINQQVAAWCLNYWTKSNPGGAAFYQKLANRAFNQVLLHEVSKCTWDLASQMVTSPNAQPNIAAIAEFESQDWIQDILKTNSAGQQDNKKAYVNPNITFPFQDDFSVGTIHGANGTRSPVAPPSEKTAPTGSAAAGTPCNQNATIEILDNNVENDVSMLTTKNRMSWLLSWSRPGDKSTRPPAVGLPPAPVSPLEVAQLPHLPPSMQAVSRLPPPMVPPAALPVQPLMGRQAMGQVANSHYQIPPCIHEEGDNKQALWTVYRAGVVQAKMESATLCNL